MPDVTNPLEAAPVELRPALGHAANRLHEEFAGMVGPETVQRLLVESYSSFATAAVQAFVPLLVERLARERLRAVARTEGKLLVDLPTVVFLCVHNAGRSQMAAGWARHLAGDRVEVFSGGSDPAGEVNPAAVAAMAEVGVDIADEYPKPWTEEVLRASDVIVTMGCGDACPLLPGKRYEDWELADPAGLGVEAVRPIRDDIGRRVRALLDHLGVAAPA